MVDLAVDGGLSQNAGRLLERGGREERIRLQRRLRDSEQNWNCRCRLAALCQDLLVDAIELEPVDPLILKEVGVARIHDADLAQHLSADHLNVLVVGVHALRLIHLLHFVNDVLLNGIRTERTRTCCGSLAPSVSC